MGKQQKIVTPTAVPNSIPPLLIKSADTKEEVAKEMNFYKKEPIGSVINKRIRKYGKKLKQIEAMEEKLKFGAVLNPEQSLLVQSKLRTSQILQDLQEIKQISLTDNEAHYKFMQSITKSLAQLICFGAISFFCNKFLDLSSETLLEVDSGKNSNINGKDHNTKSGSFNNSTTDFKSIFQKLCGFESVMAKTYSTKFKFCEDLDKSLDYSRQIMENYLLDKIYLYDNEHNHSFDEYKHNEQYNHKFFFEEVKKIQSITFDVRKESFNTNKSQPENPMNQDQFIWGKQSGNSATLKYDMACQPDLENYNSIISAPSNHFLTIKTDQIINTVIPPISFGEFRSPPAIDTMKNIKTAPSILMATEPINASSLAINLHNQLDNNNHSPPSSPKDEAMGNSISDNKSENVSFIPPPEPLNLDQGNLNNELKKGYLLEKNLDPSSAYQHQAPQMDSKVLGNENLAPIESLTIHSEALVQEYPVNLPTNLPTYEPTFTINFMVPPVFNTFDEIFTQSIDEKSDPQISNFPHKHSQLFSIKDDSPDIYKNPNTQDENKPHIKDEVDDTSHKFSKITDQKPTQINQEHLSAQYISTEESDSGVEKENLNTCSYLVSDGIGSADFQSINPSSVSQSPELEVKLYKEDNEVPSNNYSRSNSSNSIELSENEQKDPQEIFLPINDLSEKHATRSDASVTNIFDRSKATNSEATDSDNDNDHRDTRYNQTSKYRSSDNEDVNSQYSNYSTNECFNSTNQSTQTLSSYSLSQTTSFQPVNSISMKTSLTNSNHKHPYIFNHVNRNYVASTLTGGVLVQPINMSNTPTSYVTIHNMQYDSLPTQPPPNQQALPIHTPHLFSPTHATNLYHQGYTIHPSESFYIAPNVPFKIPSLNSGMSSSPTILDPHSIHSTAHYYSASTNPSMTQNHYESSIPNPIKRNVNFNNSHPNHFPPSHPHLFTSQHSHTPIISRSNIHLNPRHYHIPQISPPSETIDPTNYYTTKTQHLPPKANPNDYNNFSNYSLSSSHTEDSINPPPTHNFNSNISSNPQINNHNINSILYRKKTTNYPSPNTNASYQDQKANKPTSLRGKTYQSKPKNHPSHPNGKHISNYTPNPYSPTAIPNNGSYNYLPPNYSGGKWPFKPH